MIIVIGKNSQIGKEFKKKIFKKEIIFLSKKQLDICDNYQFKRFYDKKINLILNFSAFTKVNLNNHHDKLKSYRVNISGLRNLVNFCKKKNIHLMHISSDYVYKSNKKPKKENFKLNPLDYYAKTKYLGEQIIKDRLNSYTIIRTSHLFSIYKKNIAINLINKIKKSENLVMYKNIKFNPTSTESLANILIKLINKIEKNEITKKLIINYAQFPPTTPFKFANFIKKKIKLSKSKIKSINYEYNKNFDIKRPLNSTLDMTKINKLLNIKNKYWANDLNKLITSHEL